MSIFDYFINCFWWLFFWMFLSFLLGWFLSRYFTKKTSGDCCNELSQWKEKYAELDLKYKNLLASGSTTIKTVPEPNALGFTSHNYNPYSKLQSDNLQIIEGIGPKMETVLQNKGIHSWKELAGKTADELRSVLDAADAKRYKIIDTTKWSDQAQLAVNGEWQALIEMQKNLSAGKNETMGETDSKLEKIMVKLGLLKKWDKDDLKAIEGIGPKIAKLLQEAGIKTWDDLSDAKMEKLKEILEKAGSRYKLADPGTWPAQAELAAEGRWHELQAYQERLIGGK